MASLQSDKARSGSFLAHHHPHRLLNAAARFGVVALGSSSTRPHAAMPSSALLISPMNLQCSRSPWLSASSVVESANDVAPTPVRGRAAVVQQAYSERAACRDDRSARTASDPGIGSNKSQIIPQAALRLLPAGLGPRWGRRSDDAPLTFLCLSC